MSPLMIVIKLYGGIFKNMNDCFDADKRVCVFQGGTN
jgi:hypothetical protein